VSVNPSPKTTEIVMHTNPVLVAELARLSTSVRILDAQERAPLSADRPQARLRLLRSRAALQGNGHSV
jgi:hypothetical protein